jgi:hypothetical protein
MAKRKSTKPEGDLPYEVGKWKPPVESRFPKGVSGNPRGRPKGAKNIALQMQDVLTEPVPITVEGRQKRVPTLVATLMVARMKALGGDHKAQDRLMRTARDLALLQLPEDEGAHALTAGAEADLEALLRRYLGAEEAL